MLIIVICKITNHNSNENFVYERSIINNHGNDEKKLLAQRFSRSATKIER